MKKSNTKFRLNFSSEKNFWLRNLSAILIISMTGCSSGDTTSADSGREVIAIGPITGLGSIIVNGIRFDDSSAVVTDTNNKTTDASRLGLGMHVEVRGQLRDDQRSVATKISANSEIQGPVTNINVSGGSLTVLEHNVSVSPGTFFDGMSGLAGLKTGDVVEVYGLKDGENILADRIEKKTISSGDYLAKIRGTVEQLSDAARTFSLGKLTVNFSSADISELGANLSNGMVVEVKSMQPPIGGTLQAAKIRAIQTISSEVNYSGPLEIEGVVSNFQSLDNFKINNISVDGSSANFLRGSAQNLANGSLVEAKGSYGNGKLSASVIKFDDGTYSGLVEITGSVDSFESLSNFKVRGIRVDAAGSDVIFERGAASEIAVGRLLEIEGSMQVTENGTTILASTVKFEDRSGGNGGGGDDNPSSEFEFTGKVTDVRGDVLTIGERKVVITQTTVFRKITREQIVAGALVEVKGITMPDRTISATRISLED
jgi:hypothetical protein